MSMVDFREAIIEALDDELARDPAVLLFGEDVATAGGVFKATEGLLDRHGPERVIDTPISELALAGASFGAALMGRRPVLEIMFGDFMALAMDSLVNQSAKWAYLSNGQCRVALTIRTTAGAGGRFGAIHSQNPGIWLHGVPGLKIVCPSTPNDAKALLKAAIRDDNPTVFIEHKRLYGLKGDLAPETPAELGTAKVVRDGDDVTIVSVMTGVHEALAAATELTSHGVNAEVIDLRSLRPMDAATVIDSLQRTNRLLCVEEGPRTGGWAAGLLGQVAADALTAIDDAWIITTPAHPVPFSPVLEDAFLPSGSAIRDSVLARLGVAV